jgi:molybdopterin molybdotransferase
MVSVAEAEKIILDHLFVPETERIALEQINGRILAEEIKADRDLPPFDRATMDGIAIASKNVNRNQSEFLIEGVQAAGQPRQTLVDKEKCFEIMTGAPLPAGTDSVIPYEDVTIENKVAKISISVSQGLNVHFRGSDAAQNQTLLNPGLKISPAEVALLAAVGKTESKVYKSPTVLLISTGNELVDIGETPLPHQIRKSNSYALAAALNEIGCTAELLHLHDDKIELEETIKRILEKFELIILSGGVSKGKFDFVPQVLESLGIRKLFHHVSQRPGKPIWFGRSQKNTVFALPGNPVSTFMCFHRYVKPWLMKSLGADVRRESAILAADFSFTPALTYFLQVTIKNEGGKLLAYPIVGGGSGDFANLKEVDGFLELPLEQSDFQAGQAFPLHRFR